MYWTLLHRTIFFELTRVFLMALLALTSILLLAGIVAEASQHGLGPHQILAVIPLLIPSTLPYTLPTTTLFATCVVYGRLAHDNEVLAIKAAGVNILHVVWPAMVLGSVVSVATIGLYMHTIPYTHHLLRTKFLNDIQEFLYSKLKKDGYLQHPKIPYVIYVKQVQGKRLLDAQFMRRDPKGVGFDIIARAREAELLVDLAQNQIMVHMQQCYITSESGKERVYVEDKFWPVELPDDFRNPVKYRATDMTWMEMIEYREKLEEEIDTIRGDIASHQAVINLNAAPSHFSDHVRDLRNQKRYKENLLREVDAQMHMRPALALGCLCFVLVGCPVGIWFSKSDYLSAFITCFLPIVFLYYPLLLAGINMARTGPLPIPVAIWTANALMVIIAIGLFRRLLKN